MNRGIFEGEKGQSLFTKPFLDLLRENELPKLFKKVDGLNDHRLLTIVTALLVENRVDAILKFVYPRYDRLLDRQEYTFSMKLTTLEALRYLPPSICNTSNVIRKIRNEFAHNLNLVKFDDLRAKTKKGMLSSWKESYGRFTQDCPGNLHDVFKNISFFVIAGIEAYMENISALYDKVYSQSFIDALAEEMTQRIREVMDILGKIKPNQVVFKGDVMIICKEEGLSKIIKIR